VEISDRANNAFINTTNIYQRNMELLKYRQWTNTSATHQQKNSPLQTRNSTLSLN